MRRLYTASSLVFVSSLLAGCRCEAIDERERESAVSVSVPRPAEIGPPPLLDIVSEARRSRGAVFRGPAREELDDYGTWVRTVAKSAWSDRLPTRPAPKGFQGALGDSGSIWVLEEHPRHKRGAGLVALRPSTGRPILIEAPHTFFDSDTLELALRAFDELDARALLVNTMHRGGDGSQEARRRLALSGESEFDVAHAKDTFFARAHVVLLQLDPGLATVQIHGFSNDTAPGVDVVVSSARTNGDVRRLAKAIGESTGITKIRTYPDQIDVLGATTNVQAIACREARTPFYSVELSRSVRSRMKEDPEIARRLVQAFGVVAEKDR